MFSEILKWRHRFDPTNNIEAIYGAVVAQARLPDFYADCGVPDTPEGRFDMIVLHLFLLLRRMQMPALEKTGVPRALFDRFCVDLDANLREMGVGDLSIPRRMQKFAEAFYGRSKVYARALEAGDRTGASIAIARNILAQDFPTAGARRMADYMFKAAAMLEDTADSDIARGAITFPAAIISSEIAPDRAS